MGEKQEMSSVLTMDQSIFCLGCVLAKLCVTGRKARRREGRREERRGYGRKEGKIH